MNEPAHDLRRWTLLARVRDLRVRRCETALAHAQRGVQAARAELDRRAQRLTSHAAQLPELLALCTPGHGDTAPWKGALEQHRLKKAALDAQVRAAEVALAAAFEEVHTASAALRRERLALDEARLRKRNARARLYGEA